MKKTLLALAVAFGASSFAMAHEASVTFSTLGYTNAEDITTVKVNNDITLTFTKGENSNGPKYYNTGEAARLYAKNTLEVAGVEGVTITKVVFTTQANTDKDTYQIAEGSTVTAGTLAPADETTTWTGSANSFTLTEGGTKGHARILTMAVTYTGGTGTGSPSKGDGGDTPTPPTPEVVKVANIKAFLETASTSPAEITSPVSVAYQNGRYLYVTDGTGNLLVYGDLDQTYKNGDVIPAGITGTFNNYSNGQLQMASPVKDTFKAATAGAEIEPYELTCEEVSDAFLSQYVVFYGVSVEKAEANNTYAMADDSGDVVLYNNFANSQYYTVVEVLEGDDMVVEGFIGIHSGALQVIPVSVRSNSGLEQVAAPVFNPASGTVEAGTKVTITSATPGAKIYYTLDNSTPTTSSTLYTEPITINEATSLAAIAVKDGMDNSAVVRASYVVKQEIALTGDAVFDFSQPGTLDPAQDTPTADNATGATISEIVFRNNGTSVIFAGGSTACRLYYGYQTGVEARLYKTGTITITAPADKTIKSVEFAGAGLGNLCINGEAALTNNMWTSAEGVASVEFTATADMETANGRVDVKVIAVTYDTAGVTDVTVDANAPVEYYNLQGVRVENPESGLYIRRQGGKATKVIF